MEINCLFLKRGGWRPRDAENVAQAKSLIPLNLHKDAINIENSISLSPSLTLFSQFIDSSALAVIVYAPSLRPPFYGFINLNLIPFPCFVFSLSASWHLEFHFCPLFIYLLIWFMQHCVHHREHNYCRIQSLFLNYFKHFKIIKRSARPRTGRQPKRFEDVYDLHRKIAAGNGTWLHTARYKWLLFEVPCRSIQWGLSFGDVADSRLFVCIVSS